MEKNKNTESNKNTGDNENTGNSKNIETLNALVNNLYDVQKVRIGMANRNLALEQKSREEIFDEHVVRLKKLERDIVKEMQGQITQFPISGWLLAQRGIGPSLTGQLLAIIRDIERFGNISKLWAYSGMATMEVCRKCGRRHLDGNKKGEWIARVAKRLEDQHNKKKVKKGKEEESLDAEAIADSDAGDEDTNFVSKARKMLCDCENPDIKVTAQRRIKKTIIDYNPKMKKLCRNIALSLIQYNEFYGDMYNGFLNQYMARDNLLKDLNVSKFKGPALDKIKRGRAVKMARRKMVKIFLSHLWVQWRKIDGLPVTKPYVFDIKGHSDYIPPKEEFVELTDIQGEEEDELDV